MYSVPRGKTTVDLQDHPISAFLANPQNQRIRETIEKEIAIEFVSSTFSSDIMHMIVEDNNHGDLALKALDKLAEEITIPQNPLIRILSDARKEIEFDRENRKINSGQVKPDLKSIFGQFAGHEFGTGMFSVDDYTLGELDRTATKNGLHLRILFPGKPVTDDHRIDRVNVEVEEVSKSDTDTIWRIKGFNGG